MSEPAVRPATLADVTEIAAIHVRSWQAAYRGLMPQEYLDGLDPAARVAGWRRNLETLDRSSSGVLVAASTQTASTQTASPEITSPETAGPGIAGFVSYWPTRDDDDNPARTGEVAAIYLHPDAWGQGLGRQLMAATLENLAAAGYRDATLWVLQDNARARRFYSQAGWAADGAAKTDDLDGFPLLEVRYRRPLA
jgi:ribosomal protein S18 acetylase RimI-like enzyme